MTENERYLDQLAAVEKNFAALYRRAAAAFGLPECAMWALYFLHASHGALSQRDLAETMMFPKQTVNSAVTNLVKKGLIELAAAPGARNRKNAALTPEGQKLAARTVGIMRKAEARAVARMGEEKTKQFAALHEEFLAALNEELTREGVFADERE